MLKKLAKCVREYKRDTILTLFLMVGEAIIETLIPFITAEFLINRIQTEGASLDMGYIVTVGVILAVMAICSLTCGGLAGFTAARASAGFSKNLRHDIFGKIQAFRPIIHILLTILLFL
jgi:ATP-binding cassette subfamily B protein